jgi:hypothetical protein
MPSEFSFYRPAFFYFPLFLHPVSSVCAPSCSFVDLVREQFAMPRQDWICTFKEAGSVGLKH